MSKSIGIEICPTTDLESQKELNRVGSRKHKCFHYLEARKRAPSLQHSVASPAFATLLAVHWRDTLLSSCCSCVVLVSALLQQLHLGCTGIIVVGCIHTIETVETLFKAADDLKHSVMTDMSFFGFAFLCFCRKVVDGR